jgi:parvulin-like peptidyl-prolyl isomerase
VSQETTRRVVALCLGILLVVAFAAFAGELSDPDIPDDAIAVVEDVDNGTITQKEFDSALQQVAAAQGASGGVPKPDDPQYAQYVDAAASDLILSRWITGEAADLGITTTDREVEQQLEQIKQQNFGSEQEFQKFLDQSGFTQEEALNRVRLTVLSQKIQDYISLKAAGLSEQQALDVPSEQVQSILALTAVGLSPDEALDTPADQVQKLVKQSNPLPSEDIETVYEQQVSQFTRPESRDVLVIVNQSKDKVEQARAELEKDDSEDNWAQVAKQFSTDPSAKQGGLQPGVQEGQGDPAFDDAVFGAEQGELVGPFKTQTGWELAEVVKITPEEVEPLDKKAARSIAQQLATSAQQAAVDAFETNLEAKWRDRTFCSDELEPTPEAVATGQSSLASRCSNFEQVQMDSCTIDDPKER